MARKRKGFSLTTLLVEIFGFLMMLEAFIWVMSTKVLEGNVKFPELHYAVLVTGILLVLRVSYVLLMFLRKRKPAVFSTEAAQTTNEMQYGGCVICGKAVSEKVKSYCLAHPKRFQGNIYCFDHQRNVRG